MKITPVAMKGSIQIPNFYGMLLPFPRRVIERSIFYIYCFWECKILCFCVLVFCNFHYQTFFRRSVSIANTKKIVINIWLSVILVTDKCLCVLASLELISCRNKVTLKVYLLQS